MLFCVNLDSMQKETALLYCIVDQTWPTYGSNTSHFQKILLARSSAHCDAVRQLIAEALRKKNTSGFVEIQSILTLSEIAGRGREIIIPNKNS